MTQPYQQTAAAQQATAQVPPGWYADPMGGGGERYWDGIAWSDHFTRQSPQQAPPPTPALPMSAGPHFEVVENRPVRNPSDGNGLVVAGWVCAILFPLIGLIIGVVISSRNDPRGKWVIAVSAGMMLLSYIYLQSMMNEAVNTSLQQGATGATGAVPPPQ